MQLLKKWGRDTCVWCYGRTSIARCGTIWFRWPLSPSYATMPPEINFLNSKRRVSPERASLLLPCRPKLQSRIFLLTKKKKKELKQSWTSWWWWKQGEETVSQSLLSFTMMPFSRTVLVVPTECLKTSIESSFCWDVDWTTLLVLKSWINGYLPHKDSFNIWETVWVAGRSSSYISLTLHDLKRKIPVQVPALVPPVIHAIPLPVKIKWNYNHNL